MSQNKIFSHVANLSKPQNLTTCRSLYLQHTQVCTTRTAITLPLRWAHLDRSAHALSSLRTCLIVYLKLTSSVHTFAAFHEHAASTRCLPPSRTNSEGGQVQYLFTPNTNWSVIENGLSKWLTCAVSSFICLTDNIASVYTVITNLSSFSI